MTLLLGVLVVEVIIGGSNAMDDEIEVARSRKWKTSYRTNDLM